MNGARTQSLITASIDEEEVWTMSMVRKLFAASLTRRGVNSGQTLGRMKNRLVEHFGENLCFHRPSRRNESELIFSRSMTTGAAIEVCRDAENALHDLELEEDFKICLDQKSPMHDAFMVSLHIRKYLDDAPSMPWPPTPDWFLKTRIIPMNTSYFKTANMPRLWQYVKIYSIAAGVVAF